MEEVDKEEDREAAERKKKADEGDEKSEKDVFICPRCKRLITEADFAEDEFSEAFSTGMASKIECPDCGYEGLPVEVDRKEYEKDGQGKPGKKPSKANLKHTQGSDTVDTDIIRSGRVRLSHASGAGGFALGPFQGQPNGSMPGLFGAFLMPVIMALLLAYSSSSR